MPVDIQLVPKAREVLLRLKDVDGRADLMERLGEFFPQDTDFAWLTGDNDGSFRDAFYLEQGGWLDAGQYAQFWGYIGDYSADTGSDQLAAFLEELVTGWENAIAASQGQALGLAEPTTTPRFQAVGPVDGYPGWWQGYDSVDGVWKYVQATGAAPGDQTPGWAISSVAFRELSATAEAGQLQASSSATLEERAESVYALVLEEVTEPTSEEIELLWSDVWAKVTAVDESGAGWSPQSAAEIADQVINEHFTRALTQDEAVSADELIAEIQAIRALLIEHVQS